MSLQDPLEAVELLADHGKLEAAAERLAALGPGLTEAQQGRLIGYLCCIGTKDSYGQVLLRLGSLLE